MPNGSGRTSADARFIRRLLPKEWWIIERLDERRVAAGIWEYPEDYVSWDVIALSDLPNDLIGAEDLERFGIAINGLHDTSTRKDP